MISSSEPVADHATCKIPRKPRTVQRIRSKATSLAELIASREGKRVRDCEDERNDCRMLAFQFTGLTFLNLAQPSTAHLYPIQVAKPLFLCPQEKNALTDQRQPNKLQPNQRKHRQHNPQHRLHIQRHPKEPSIRRILLPGLWIRALKHPAPVTRCAVDLVPPAQPDEAPPGDVLEVVEVDCE